MKLASKERVGSKVVRQHGEAKTPLHRGLTCAEVSPATKKRLRTEKRANNPFALTREVERHVKVIEAGDQRRLDRGAETDRKKPVKKRERG